MYQPLMGLEHVNKQIIDIFVLTGEQSGVVFKETVASSSQVRSQ